MHGVPTFSDARTDRLAALQDDHFWFVGRRRLLETLLDARLGASGRVLDIGCGAGGTLRWLRSLGHDPVGVDSSRRALAHAAACVPEAELHLSSSCALPFASNAFDGALILDVLEHVEEAPTLAEARRVVRPGGWVAVSVPAWPSLRGVRDVDAGHVRRYTHRRLVNVVRRSGFVVERVTYYQCALFPFFVASRLAGRDRRSLRDAEEDVPAWLSRALAAVNTAEARLSRFVDLPFGSSLVLRARRP